MKSINESNNIDDTISEGSSRFDQESVKKLNNLEPQ